MFINYKIERLSANSRNSTYFGMMFINKPLRNVHSMFNVHSPILPWNNEILKRAASEATCIFWLLLHFLDSDKQENGYSGFFSGLPDAGQNKSFTFSLTIGSTFAFSLDTKEILTPVAEAVKTRKSPSPIRRNARRSRISAKESFHHALATSLMWPWLPEIASQENRQKWLYWAYHVGIWFKYDRFGSNSSRPLLGSPLMVWCTKIILVLDFGHFRHAWKWPFWRKLEQASSHCGLSKKGHPGPTGDRCLVPRYWPLGDLPRMHSILYVCTVMVGFLKPFILRKSLYWLLSEINDWLIDAKDLHEGKRTEIIANRTSIGTFLGPLGLQIH